MSRTFSKILMICAMVVIIPLMVVGTAFVAYYSVDSEIFVKALLVDGEKCDVEGTYARVEYNGNKGETVSVKAGHTAKVDVRADYTSNAYDFLGWFKGNEESYKTAKAQGNVDWASQSTTITISMEEESDYVAVYEVVKYKTSWDYEVQPQKQTVQDAPEGGKNLYKYGEALPTLTCTEENYTFGGWQVRSADDKRFVDATFDYKYSTRGSEGATGVVLTNPWKKADVVTLTFVYKTASVTKEVIKGQQFEDLEQVKSELLAKVAEETTKKGYNVEFSWAEDILGATKVPSLAPQNDMTIYLCRKETPITYTVSPKLDGVESGKTASFTIEKDGDKRNELNALFATTDWNFEHKFYEFGGLTFNGQTYTTADAFATAFIDANPSANPAEANVEVNVVENYSEFNANFSFMATDGADADDFAYTVKYNSGSGTSNVTKQITDGEYTTITLEELLELSKVENHTWFVEKDGQKHAITLSAIEFELPGEDGERINIEITDLETEKLYTIADILDVLIGSDDAYGIKQACLDSEEVLTTFTFEKINVKFLLGETF